MDPGVGGRMVNVEIKDSFFLLPSERFSFGPSGFIAS